MPFPLRLCSAGMDVEVRHLRAFLAVARSGSFTRASEHLLITQPALTRTIQQLEAILQVTLLERTSRHPGQLPGPPGSPVRRGAGGHVPGTLQARVV